jgi:hypothetical protein
VRQRETVRGSVKKIMVDVEKGQQESSEEWFQLQAIRNGRLLTMRAMTPFEQILPDTTAAIARLDHDSSTLDPTLVFQLQQWYQTSLFLAVYLSTIGFNTEASEVRMCVRFLQSTMSRVNLAVFKASCGHTLFNILLFGAMASRCRAEGCWFVETLSDTYPEMQSFSHILELLKRSFDPRQLVTSVIDEIWQKIIELRGVNHRK